MSCENAYVSWTAKFKRLTRRKEKVNRDVSDRKAVIEKEGKQLQTTEQKIGNENDARLQASISASLQSRQQLDSKEAADLNALQNSLGKNSRGLESINCRARSSGNK
jgi:hypothetical protein